MCVANVCWGVAVDQVLLCCQRLEIEKEKMDGLHNGQQLTSWGTKRSSDFGMEEGRGSS